jgi:hypothetical protein
VLDYLVLPDILDITSALFFNGLLNYLGVFEPPRHAGAVAVQGFRPKLVTITL